MLVIATQYDAVTNVLAQYATNIPATNGPVLATHLTTLCKWWSTTRPQALAFFGHGRTGPPAGFEAQDRKICEPASMVALGQVIVAICCHGDLMGPAVARKGGQFIGFAGELWVPVAGRAVTGMRSAFIAAPTVVAQSGSVAAACQSAETLFRQYAQAAFRSATPEDRFGSLFAGMNADSIQVWV